jgi:tetratricopeptide (TPR) repeat protein
VRAWAEESQVLAEAHDDGIGRRFALYNLANIHWSDPDRRETLLNQMLDSAVQAGDKWSIQEALAGLGWTAVRRQDQERAQEYFDKRLAKARAHGDPWHVAWGLRDLSQLAYLQGRTVEGLAYLEEAFQVGKDLWSRQIRAGALLMQGEMVRLLGDLDRAEALYQAALPLFREIKSWGRTAPVLHNLAQIALVRGDLRRARRQFREALDIGRTLTTQQYIIRECVIGLGEVAVAEGDFVRGVQLFAAVDGVLDAFEFPLQPTDRPPYDAAMAQARAALDPAAWEAAWAAGSALSLETAARLALAEAAEIISAA